MADPSAETLAENDQNLSQHTHKQTDILQNFAANVNSASRKNTDFGVDFCKLLNHICRKLTNLL